MRTSYLLSLFGLLMLVSACRSGREVSQSQIPDFPVENYAATEYLYNSVSTFSNVQDSVYRSTFFDKERAFRPDQPRTKTITFASSRARRAVVTMATDARFCEKVLEDTITLTDGQGSYTLRNFVPGRTYYYKVEAGGRKLLKGALRATGRVRMIALDRGFNIRDLGGWTGYDGRTVRYEQIYRGASIGGTDMDGQTSDITDADRAELSRIGIRAQLDLRAPTDKGLYAGEHSLHSYALGRTTLSDADYNNTMTDHGAYDEDASVVSDIAWIIYELRRGRPVYFNCRQGADRTGTIAFVVEALLGCYGEDEGHQMAMDYELTGFSGANLVDNVKVASSYRGATEAYGNRRKLFRKLLSLEVEGITFCNLQERVYYYLNRAYAEHGATIDSRDLDWFICHMLGIDNFPHPIWAGRGDELKHVAEMNAQVVTYCP